mmetsp:Transcript_16702/g.31269  ORF Transcript_16702/g.31269 Transcript_16702/m.31269 type:complete len:315 (+) Transcript_16702:1466-2410(+)
MRLPDHKRVARVLATLPELVPSPAEDFSGPAQRNGVESSGGNFQNIAQTWHLLGGRDEELPSLAGPTLLTALRELVDPPAIYVPVAGGPSHVVNAARHFHELQGDATEFDCSRLVAVPSLVELALSKILFVSPRVEHALKNSHSEVSSARNVVHPQTLVKFYQSRSVAKAFPGQGIRRRLVAALALPVVPPTENTSSVVQRHGVTVACAELPYHHPDTGGRNAAGVQALNQGEALSGFVVEIAELALLANATRVHGSVRSHDKNLRGANRTAHDSVRHALALELPLQLVHAGDQTRREEVPGVCFAQNIGESER